VKGKGTYRQHYWSYEEEATLQAEYLAQKVDRKPSIGNGNPGAPHLEAMKA
jgi:hypothetical protein